MCGTNCLIIRGCTWIYNIGSNTKKNYSIAIAQASTRMYVHLGPSFASFPLVCLYFISCGEAIRKKFPISTTIFSSRVESGQLTNFLESILTPSYMYSNEVHRNFILATKDDAELPFCLFHHQRCHTQEEGLHNRGLQ